MASLNSLRTALWRVPPGASSDRPPVRRPFRIAGGLVALLVAVVVAARITEWVATGQVSGETPDEAAVTVVLMAAFVVLGRIGGAARSRAGVRRLAAGSLWPAGGAGAVLGGLAPLAGMVLNP
jgi:hypothetical protein